MPKLTFLFAREATKKDREKARIYAKFHAHMLYGDTKLNRKENKVNAIKERKIIESVTQDTDLWWEESLGICEENLYFTGNEKVIKYNGKWYITIPQLEMPTDMISGMNRIFCNKKEIKKAFGEKFFRLSKEQQKKFNKFWEVCPNGIVLVGEIEEIKKKYANNYMVSVNQTP